MSVPCGCCLRLCCLKQARRHGRVGGLQRLPDAHLNQRAGDRPWQPLPSTDATMLHFTALTGSVEGLQRAAVQFPHFVAMPNADGCTPLFLAARVVGGGEEEKGEKED